MADGPYKHAEFGGHPKEGRPWEGRKRDEYGREPGPPWSPVGRPADPGYYAKWECTCDHLPAGEPHGEDCPACNSLKAMADPEQSPAADYGAHRLAGRIFALGLDEQRLLLDLLARIELGRKRYGEWKAWQEERNLDTEKREEVLDLLVYDAMGRVAAKPKKEDNVEL